MDKSANPKGLRQLAIFSIYLIAMGVGTVTPAIQAMIGYWAPTGVGISTILLVSTLPTLTMVPATIISGAIAGKKVGFKPLAIAGSALFAVFGSMPAIFTSSWAFVLFCRAMFGIGLGLISPLANALVLGLYSEDTRSAFLGYGTMTMNAGGIILQLLAGILSSGPATWNLCFWAHALGFISVALCFFLPEPPKAAPEAAGEKGKNSFPAFVWVGSIVLFLFMLVNYGALMNCSSWVMYSVFGGDEASNYSFIAAIACDIFTVGGMVSSAVFGKFFGKLGKMTLALGCFIAAVGALLMRFCGTSIPLLVIGYFLDGFGFCLLFPGIFAYVGMTTPLKTQAFAISVITAIMSIAGFFCTYFLMFVVAPIFKASAPVWDTTGYLAGEFIIAAIVFALLGIFWIAYNPLKGKEAPSPQAEEITK